MLKLWSQPIKDLNLNHHKFNTLAANPIGTHPANVQECLSLHRMFRLETYIKTKNG